MSGKVWISSLLSSGAIGNKQGLRVKHHGEDWTPASFNIPISSENTRQNLDRYARGFAMQRSGMPDAAAVWDEKSFRRVGNLFTAGGYYVVQGKLVELLSRFDLGEGGLVPFTIYQADLQTPYPGEYFLLNFGAIKNTILPEQSENVVKFVVHHKTGKQIWEVNGWHEDGDVALSAAALGGPDLWFEDIVFNKIFMSDALALALQEAGLADDWLLKQCRISGVIQ